MNKKFFLVSWDFLIPGLILAAFSLTTLLSISFDLFKNQLFFLGISLAVFFFFSQVNYQIIRLYSIPFYICSLVLFILILLIGIESRGSIRWFELLGLRIQFSEIFKPFLAISLSSYLANHENYSFKTFLSILGFLLPVVFLIFLQPDLGNALIYLGVVLTVLIIGGFPIRFFAVSAVSLALIFPIIWNFLHDYQKQRLLTFLHPDDPLGSSYNAIQSVIAVGSGQFLGRGFGLGTQSGLKFLPERHTDFIFATISENLGFVGAFLVVLVFTYLVYRIFNNFSNTNDRFCQFFYITAFSLILVQFFVNVGMNIGILPVVGVTLPFVSYGGSSLVSNFILLGLLSAIGKGASSRSALEIK